MLILVIVGTLLYGGRPGVLWAFIGGLGLDVFSGGPLGASSLALMAAALVASLGHRPLSRFNLLVPLGAAALGTLTYAVGLPGHSGRAQCDAGWFARDLPFLETMRYIVLPATLYNTAIDVAAAAVAQPHAGEPGPMMLSAVAMVTARL